MVLGADASNAEAVRQVFALKGRPANHPVIVHLAAAKDLAKWAVDVSEEAFQTERGLLARTAHPHFETAATRSGHRDGFTGHSGFAGAESQDSASTTVGIWRRCRRALGEPVWTYQPDDGAACTG